MPKTTTCDPRTLWLVWDDDGLPPRPLDTLRAAGTHDGMLEQLGAQLDRFTSLFEHYGTTVAVDRYVAAARTWEERLDAQATLNTLARLSGLPARHFGAGWAPPFPHLRYRVLRDLELGLVRLVARADNDVEVLVGALETGAASGELPVLGADAVRTSATTGVELALPGGGLAEFARTNPVPAWAADAMLRGAATAQQRGRPLGYANNATDRNKIQSAQLMKLGPMWAAAGLRDDPTVAHESIRHTAAHHVHQRAGIEAAARFLGTTSLDRVSIKIGARPWPPRRARRTNR